jgi:hypothetical protein
MGALEKEKPKILIGKDKNKTPLTWPASSAMTHCRVVEIGRCKELTAKGSATPGPPFVEVNSTGKATERGFTGPSNVSMPGSARYCPGTMMLKNR